MPSSSKLFDLELARFFERAAAPGALHVALCLGSLGAGLASMALRGADGEEKPADAYGEGRVLELEELWRGLLPAPEAGVEAVEVVEASTAALRLLALGAKGPGGIGAERRDEVATAAAALRAAAGSGLTLARAAGPDEDLERTLSALEGRVAGLCEEILA